MPQYGGVIRPGFSKMEDQEDRENNARVSSNASAPATPPMERVKVLLEEALSIIAREIE